MSLADNHPEHGVCPEMSAGYPAQETPNGIQAPPGFNLTTIVAQAPCMGARCQKWDAEAAMCCHASQALYFRGLLSAVQKVLAELRTTPD